MDTKIDLEHIKSLKDITLDNGWEYGQPVKMYLDKSLMSVSTEDSEIFMVWISPREDNLTAYIIVVGQKSFSFCIKHKLATALKTYEGDDVMNIWIDEILCDVVDYSGQAAGYVHFANQNSFASKEERDVIVDFFKRCVATLGKPHPARSKITKFTRVMFTEHAKEQLAAYDE